MKRLIILFVLTLITSNMAFAQDTIITKDGDVWKAYNVEISSSAVFYKNDASEASPIQRIEKNKVYMIKHSNGTKTIIDDTATTIATQTTIDKDAIGMPDEEYNAHLMAAINNNSVQYVEDKKKKKDKKKEANNLYCQFFATPGSLLANKDIEVTYTSGEIAYYFNNKKLMDNSSHPEFVANSHYNSNRCISISIKNRTEKTIFIDLGNTFFIRNGEAVPYYTPSSTSNTSGSNTGIGVGLGAIADAAGIGGTVGKVASGITVGGGKNNATTTTIYSQRIVSIPPMSSKKLDEQLIIPEEFASLFPKISLKSSNGGSSSIIKNNKRIVMSQECMEGDLIEWNNQTSPIKWGTFITYAFDENFSSSAKMKADFFLKKGIALRKERITTLPKSTIFLFADNKF